MNYVRQSKNELSKLTGGMVDVYLVDREVTAIIASPLVTIQNVLKLKNIYADTTRNSGRRHITASLRVNDKDKIR